MSTAQGPVASPILKVAGEQPASAYSKEWKPVSFLLTISSRVPALNRDVDIEITGFESPVRLSLDKISMMPPGYRAIFPIPGPTLQVTIRVRFRKLGTSTSARATVSNCAGLDIVQLRPHYLIANFLNAAPGQAEGRSTLICETTDETQSGANVCLDCPAGAAVVKVCC